MGKGNSRNADQPYKAIKDPNKINKMVTINKHVNHTPKADGSTTTPINDLPSKGSTTTIGRSMTNYLTKTEIKKLFLKAKDFKNNRTITKGQFDEYGNLIGINEGVTKTNTDTNGMITSKSKDAKITQRRSSQRISSRKRGGKAKKGTRKRK